MSTTEVPLHTTKPSIRVSWFSLYGSSGSGKVRILVSNDVQETQRTRQFPKLPRRYSVVLSSTKFKRGSYPLRIPAASLPPANFTLIFFSKYFERSRMLSFFFFSFASPWAFCCYKKYRDWRIWRLARLYNDSLPVSPSAKRSVSMRSYCRLPRQQHSIAESRFSFILTDIAGPFAT